MKNFFLSFVLFFIVGSVFAQVKSDSGLNVQDKIVASTFKVMAKIYLSTVDENQLKNKAIRSLTKMNNDKYKKRYAEIYAALKDYPQVTSKYRLVSDMSKEKAMARINAFSKRDLNILVEDIPDECVIREYNIYLKEKQKDNANKRDMLEEVHKTWENILLKMKDFK
jgi:hypothetical protein